MERQNNFDALRLVAAASVVFSHSFLITEGTQDHEWLIWLTGNQSILGLVGVFVFFAISGFLVTQSFEETGDPWRFLAKRALRIFPGLLAATALSAFVLAPCVTTLWPSVFLLRPEPYEYVIGNTLLDQTVHELPGVMFANNPVGLEINGSLWTLRLEFTMYLMVLVLGVLRLLTVRSALLLIAFGMICLHFNMLDELEKWGWFFQLLSGWGWLVGFFAAGMVFYKLRHTRIFDGRIALLAFAGLVLSVPLRQFILLFPLFGCYLALWLALTPRLPVIPAARFGDLSYGIYIYGWPVEAILTAGLTSTPASRRCVIEERLVFGFRRRAGLSTRCQDRKAIAAAVGSASRNTCHHTARPPNSQITPCSTGQP